MTPAFTHLALHVRGVALLSQVVVATDDERIAKAVEGFGGSWVMTRRNHATGTDRLAEAAGLLESSDQDVLVV